MTEHMADLVSFLAERRHPSPSAKQAVETDPGLEPCIRHIAQGRNLRLASLIISQLGRATPFLVESYPLHAGTLGRLSRTGAPPAERLWVQRFLNQLRTIPPPEILSARHLLKEFGDLIPSGQKARRTVVSRCSKCGAVDRPSARSYATPGCACDSTLWELAEIAPTRNARGLLKDDFFLELALKIRVAGSMNLLGRNSGDLCASLSYKAASRFVEVDLLGLRGEVLAFFEAKTSSLTPNEISGKRGQILELLEAFSEDPKDFVPIRPILIFVSPVPSKGVKEGWINPKARLLPACVISDRGIDALEERLDFLLDEI